MRSLGLVRFVLLTQEPKKAAVVAVATRRMRAGVIVKEREQIRMIAPRSSMVSLWTHPSAGQYVVFAEVASQIVRSVLLLAAYWA